MTGKKKDLNRKNLIKGRVKTRNLRLLIPLFIMLFLLAVVIYAATGNVNLILGTSYQISINHPKNLSYNFSLSDVYPLNLSITYSGDLNNFTYRIQDLKHGVITYENVSFDPSSNVTINFSRWSNRIDVYSIDPWGSVYSDWLILFINVNNTSPVLDSIDEQMYVCENSFISYKFNASDSDEDNLGYTLTPQFPNSPFYIDYVSRINATKWKYKVYSGYIDKEDVGGNNNGFITYSEAISIDDGEYADSANINITLIEVNNAPNIQNIGVQTIWTYGTNSSLYIDVGANDTEDGDKALGNLSFSIGFTNRVLFNISNDGVLNFNASVGDSGNYNVTVCVEDLGLSFPHKNISLCNQDGGSISTCDNFNLTITHQNRAPSIEDYYPGDLNINTTGSDILYFNVTNSDPDLTTPDTYWYVNGNLVEYDSGDLTEELSYSFGCGISGLKIISANITDGELNDSMEWNVTVSLVACPPGVSRGDSGGGGGGGTVVNCTENWGCSVWPMCNNLFEDFEAGLIDSSINKLISERCLLFNWSQGVCGYQVRDCQDLNKCRTNLSQPGEIRECYYSKNPNCADGIKNCHDSSCEVLIDCGGPCLPCPSCSDNILNQGEEDVDCGGPCKACPLEFPIKIDWLKVMICSSLYLLIFVILLLIYYFFNRYNHFRLLNKRKMSLLFIFLSGFMVILFIFDWYLILNRCYMPVFFLILFAIALILIIGLIVKYYKNKKKIAILNKKKNRFGIYKNK